LLATGEVKGRFRDPGDLRKVGFVVHATRARPGPRAATDRYKGPGVEEPVAEPQREALGDRRLSGSGWTIDGDNDSPHMSPIRAPREVVKASAKIDGVTRISSESTNLERARDL